MNNHYKLNPQNFFSINPIDDFNTKVDNAFLFTLEFGLDNYKLTKSWLSGKPVGSP